MTQSEKFQTFRALHHMGNPFVLYNIWDAGSAKAVAGAGAVALATGSAPLAVAQGFADGENIPLDLALGIVRRIVDGVDLPVSMDFEGGYAVDPATITANVTRVLETGAVGVNFEDQVIGGAGLYDIETQVTRIAAVRAASADVFINARTDLFLKEPDGAKHAELMEAAITRAAAFKAAGADGFFAPGLVDGDLIGALCAAVALPVNILKKPTAPDHDALGKLGVARISYGPLAHNGLMAELAQRFENL